MTVSSTLDRKTYTGDGLTVAFATSPMVFFDETDLLVYVITTATGAAELQSLTTDYTVSGGDGSTGTVTMLTAPSAAQKLLIKRVVPYIQATDHVNNDASDAEVLEDVHDKVVMGLQQLAADKAYALRIPDAETPTDALTTLPFDRASSVLGFDASKNLTTYDASSAVTEASNVTFLQSGNEAPGTVASAIAQLCVNVKQPPYSAQGDGSADDTTAINSAYAAAASAGRGLYFPSGTYKFVSALSWTSAVSVYGEPSQSILKPSSALNSSVCVTITPPLDSNKGNAGKPVTVYGIDFDGGNTSGATGVELDGPTFCDNLRLDRCDIHHFGSSGGIGLLLDKSLRTEIVGCNITHNYVNVKSLSSDDTFPTTARFVNSFIRQATTIGAEIKQGFLLTFDGCTIESNGEEGVAAVAGANKTIQQVVFEKSWFENNWGSTTTEYQVVGDGSASGASCSVQLKGCFFAGSGSTAKAVSLNKVVDFLFDDVKLPNVAATVLIADINSNGYVLNHPDNHGGTYASLYSISGGTVRHYRTNIESYESAWTTYVPSFTAGGSMTFTSTTAHVAKYKKNGKTVFLEVWVTGTIGGTPSSLIVCSLPAGITPQNTGNYTPCAIKDNGAWENGLMEFGASDGVYFRKAAAWTGAADAGFAVAVSFECE
jgi:hypothetical protein